MHLPLSLGQVFNILHTNRMKADCPLPSPSKQLDGPLRFPPAIFDRRGQPGVAFCARPALAGRAARHEEVRGIMPSVGRQGPAVLSFFDWRPSTCGRLLPGKQLS